MKIETPMKTSNTTICSRLKESVNNGLMKR